MEPSTLSGFTPHGSHVILEHVEMAIFRIFLIAEIFKQIGLYVPLRDLGRLIGQPIQIFDDVVKMLGAVESGLFLGQLPLRPQVKKGMVFAVSIVTGGDKLVDENEVP